MYFQSIKQGFLKPFPKQNTHKQRYLSQATNTHDLTQCGPVTGCKACKKTAALTTVDLNQRLSLQAIENRRLSLLLITEQSALFEASTSTLPIIDQLNVAIVVGAAVKQERVYKT